MTTRKKIIWTIAIGILPFCLAAQELEMPLENGQGALFGSLQKTESAHGHLPLILFISGSGPTDRNGNQNMGGSNAIAFLADSLAYLGISSFRFDKRSVGKSQIMDLREDDLLIDTFVADVVAWIDYLAKENPDQKYILAGHSEGALIATMAAGMHSSVLGVISIAGAGRPADSLMLQQFKRQPAFVAVAADSLFRQLRAGEALQPPPYLLSLFRPGILPYLRRWIMINPADELAKLELPVLILGGDEDIQVFIEDADLLSAAAQNGQKVIFPNMNHVLKAVTSPTDNMASYMDAERPIYPGLASVIYHWVYSNFHQ